MILMKEIWRDVGYPSVTTVESAVTELCGDYGDKNIVWLGQNQTNHIKCKIAL